MTLDLTQLAWYSVQNYFDLGGNLIKETEIVVVPEGSTTPTTLYNLDGSPAAIPLPCHTAITPGIAGGIDPDGNLQFGATQGFYDIYKKGPPLVYIGTVQLSSMPLLAIPPLSSGRFVGANKVGALVYTGTGGAASFQAQASSAINVNPGDQMTVSGYIDATACTVANAMSLQVLHPGLGSLYANAAQSPGAAGWVTSTFTVPVGVTQVVLMFTAVNGTYANGGKAIGACPRLELGPYANPFFAPGNLAPDPQFLNGLTSWSGGAGGLTAVAPGSVPGQFAPPSGPPASGTWQKDDQSTDESGKLYVCTRGGTVGGNLLSAAASEFEDGSTGGWSVGSGAGATVTNSTAQAHTGTHSLALTMGGSAGGQMSANGPTQAMTPNQVYRASAWVRAGATPRSVMVGLVFLDASVGAVSFPAGPSVVDSTTGWALVQFEAVAPPGTAYGAAYVQVANPAAGEVHYIDTVSLVPDVTWRRPGDEPRLLVPGGEAVIDPRVATASTPTLNSGWLVASSFIADKSETVSQMTFACAAAAGATPTLCRFGLYWIDEAGNAYLVGVTANDTSIFAGANTRYTRSLTNPVAKVAGQRYAAAVIVVTGAALPAVVCAPAMPGPGFGTHLPFPAFWQGGLGDLPAFAPGGSSNAWNNPPYAEVTP